MNNLTILIVFYNKQLSQSVAFQTLHDKIDNPSIDLAIKLVIWNNSPSVSIDKGDYAYYEGMNSTLPKIYNNIARKYLTAEDDYLMISDDDTDYSNFHFNELTKIIQSYSRQTTGVFIPKLYSSKQLVSPGTRVFFKGKYIDDIPSGLTKSKNLLAMNSGLIISYSCMKKMPLLFDERLNFYGTDSDFFIRYENYFTHLYVLPFCLQHDLSENNNDIERALFRKNDNLHALNIIFSNRSFLEKVLFKIYLIYSKLKGLK